MTGFEMQAIGCVRGGREAVEDDAWGSVVSRIELDRGQFGPDAFAGLETCSHVEVLFVFDQVDPEAVCRGARHPRGREDWPLVGIFAQRAKDRPNRIGSTVCHLVRVDGTAIEVSGLDAVDGTPVLDVKPYLAEFGPRGTVRQPTWATELMTDYW
ncbi:MAG: SAM-dependent methyltransferase [Acidimicrobiia bacterium]